MSVGKGLNWLRRLASQAGLIQTPSDGIPQLYSELQGINDMPSIGESIAAHTDVFPNYSQEAKSFNTKDPETLSIYRRITASNPWLEQYGIYPTSSKTGIYASKTITIADLDHAPTSYKHMVSLAKTRSEISRFFIGGPSAESATLLFSILKKHHDDLVKFRVGRISESNVAHSSSQHHRRHASAVNVDSNRTGHTMLPIFMKRFFITPTIPEILESDYTKIDLFSHNLRLGNIPIYIGNELHWAKNKIRHILGQKTAHNTNVLMAADDKEIADYINKTTGARLLSSHQSDTDIGIHVVTSKKDLHHLEQEHKELFANTNVRYSRLTKEELNQLFGDEQRNIEAAFRYEGDCMALYDAFYTYKRIAQGYGVDWQENRELCRVFVSGGSDGETILAGLEFKDLESGKIFFEPADSAYLSLGYTNTYSYERIPAQTFESSVTSSLDIVYSTIYSDYARPVPMHDIATGVSVNAIFEVDETMRRILDENNGRYMETSISNSHWTLIALDDDKNHALMRMTAGGNMASEMYSSSYFLNLMGNTRRIYGDKLIGIVSTYGCPRSINAKNSGEFIKICEGLVASYGHGGTGITKKNVTAAIALSALGFKDEVAALHKEYPYLFANYDVSEIIKDNSSHTKRIMGYDDSFSLGEKAVAGFAMFCGVLAAIALLKDKENQPDTRTR